MSTASGRRASKDLALLRWAALAGVGLLILSGCAGKRSLTIERDAYINNEMQASYPPSQKRSGFPLEVAVVLVYPNDLKEAANDRLRPNSGITSKDWFEQRPTRDGGAGGRFRLAEDQVLLFTNDSATFGLKRGEPLQGTEVSGTKPVKVDIEFKKGANDQNAVIYVFGKFTDKDGYLLPVAPAAIVKPASYSNDLSVRIGVDWNRSGIHQFIENTSPRK